MRETRHIAWIFTASSVFLALIGCGDQGDRPPLGKVTGHVTVNGEPLAGVIISFKPEVGRAAAGLTDANGFYRLQYVQGVNGAKVGTSTVSFSWPTGSSGSVAIPEKYGSKSTLSEEVTSGSNTFDFDLEIESESGGATPKKPTLPD